jgi:hypothetical protein
LSKENLIEENMANFRTTNRIRVICALLVILLGLALYNIVNVISGKCFFRKTFNKNSGFVLRDESKNILGSLKSGVEIFVLLEKTQEYAETFDLISHDLRRITNEYVRACNTGRFEVEIINVAENPKRYATLCGRFGILPTNCVIITTNNKTKVLAVDEFYNTQNGHVISFKGERVISSVLQELTSEDKNIVYFLVGHGEYELDNVSSAQGLSTLEHLMKQRNCEPRPINLYDSKAIPSDADFVVIAGARSKFLGFEKEILRDYVDNRNGKVVIALGAHSDTGLIEFLGDYGITVGDALLISTDAQTVNYFDDLIIKRFAPHKINTKLIEFRVPIVFGPSCEARQAPWFIDTEKFEVTELMQTDDVAEHAPGREENEKMPRIVAVISEQRKFDASEVTNNAGKILVIGNADFLSNGKIKLLGNRIFWFGISDYLLYRENTGDFEDIDVGSYRLALSKSDFIRIVLKISFLPISFLMLAVFVAFQRRK